MKNIIHKIYFCKGSYSLEENKKYFINILRRNILYAVELWDKKHKPEYKVKIANSFISGMESAKQYASKQAEKKYKRESKRQEFINEYLAKYISSRSQELYECKRYPAIEYFDLDFEPWTNSMHGTCSLSVNNLSDKAIEACWNDIKDNVYFKEAEGMTFEYDGTGRPQINLILPKNIQKEFDKDKENLTKAIENFYSNCTYWGD